MANINQRLNGLEPLAYAGVNAVQPPDFITRPVDPTTSDSRNFYLGAIWLNTTTEDVWMLVSLLGSIATWVMITGAAGSILTLTGNTGGAVGPLAGNINVVGDGTTISVAGNAATHTLTIETVGTGVVNTLTGNNAVAVSPTAGNINVIGDGTTITITGNAGTHTLTASLIGGGGPAITGLKSQDGDTVTPTAGIIQISGSNGITTTGTVGPNTLTITAGGSIAQSFPTDFTSPATPSAGVLNILGGTSADSELGALTYRKNIHTAAVTDTVFVKLNDSLSFPATNSAGTAGVIYVGAVAAGNRFLSNYGGVGANIFLGGGSGNFTNTGNYNIGAGLQVFAALTSGAFNVALGATNLTALTSGGNNCALGHNVLSNLTTATDNTGCGTHTLNAITTGSFNTAVGSGQGPSTPAGVLAQLTTGSYNTAIGGQIGASTGAGWNYTSSESSNIVIGPTTIGTTGESNVMRIGTTGSGNGQQNKCFIAAIRGVTTDVADAIAVLISSTGQLGTVSSSMRYKENVKDIGEESSSLLKLHPVVFNYKNHKAEHISYGLIAEEVYEIAPQLVVKDEEGLPASIKYHELPVLLLNELQRQNRIIELLMKRVQSLEEKFLEA